jgi:tryptophan-rich sensory protein
MGTTIQLGCDPDVENLSSFASVLLLPYLGWELTFLVWSLELAVGSL